MYPLLLILFGHINVAFLLLFRVCVSMNSEKILHDKKKNEKKHWAKDGKKKWSKQNMLVA